MTKKNYVAAARLIQYVYTPSGEKPILKDEHRRVSKLFATFFHEDNPRFDEDRFYFACGLSKDQF